MASDASESVAPAGEADRDLVLVLLGRTGVGKSSTANSLLGSAEFEARRKVTAVTDKCSAAVRHMHGRRVLVVDTPGWGSDLGVIEAATKVESAMTDGAAPAPAAAGRAEDWGEIYADAINGGGANALHKEIVRGLDHATRDTPWPREGAAELATFADAPVALLLVFSCASRISRDDLTELATLRHHVFGKAMFERACVVWTHPELLDAAQPGASGGGGGGAAEAALESFLEDADAETRLFLRDVAGGAVLMDNAMAARQADALAAGRLGGPHAAAQLERLMRAAVSVEGPRGAPVPLNAKHARIARRLQMQQRMQEERAAAGGRGFCALM